MRLPPPSTEYSIASRSRAGTLPSPRRTSARCVSIRRRYPSRRSANASFGARAIIPGHPNTEPARTAQAFVDTESSRIDSASANDLAYQAHILPGVSRTFALTIPVLPQKLARVMTNAYLLCRLADTIEDDVGLDNLQKSVFHARFIAVVKGTD